jgi:hypothetical protein
MSDKTSGPGPIQNTNGEHLVDFQKSFTSANLSSVLSPAPALPNTPAPTAPSPTTGSAEGASGGGKSGASASK